MSKMSEIRAAKQEVSASLLRAGWRGGVVGRRTVLSVHAAVASAGSNVHAVGIGRKVVADSTTTTPCVRLYVVQKIAESLLPPRDRLPSDVAGIPTDVIESPPAFLAAKKKSSARRVKKKKAGGVTAAAVPACSASRQAEQRPVVGGISAAHFAVTAGTISCFCCSTHQEDDPSAIFVMSNNHVFADVNKADLGDGLYQPGPADGAMPADHFADLHRFVTIDQATGSTNRVDAAIGALRSGVKFKAEICTIGRINGTDEADEDMVVCKHGRTTGYTEGVVADVAYDALVGMDHSDSSKVAMFQDQIRIEAAPGEPYFGLGGDSGSLVVCKSSAAAVGLYFAGPASGFYGIANHIADVLNELQVDLL